MTIKKSKSVDHAAVFAPGGRRREADAVARDAARGGIPGCRLPKPQIGVASTWASLTPCNMHINELATEAMAGADAAGGKGVLFNTITVSDGISMGSPGMRYSLVSREVIADSIETVVGCRGLRRLRRHRRLRQEHAGLRHGHRAPESPGGVRLRRHDPPGREAPRHRLGVRSGRRPCRGPRLRRGTARGRAHRDPGPGQLRRHVHRQHDGLGDRGARHVAA